MKVRDLSGLSHALSDNVACIPITGLAVNSADVRPGFVFFGLPGINVDGAGFVEDAQERGAIAAVISQGSMIDNVSIPLLTSEEPRTVLANAAARFFSKQPDTIAAVTGTAGKTSVVTFLRQIWERTGKRAASIGTTGVNAPGHDQYGNLTTPDPVTLHRLLDELAGCGVTHAAMEASSHGLDQHRLDGVRLSVAGFTNLGRDHLDYHATLQEYFLVKQRLFIECLPMGAPAVIFADDPCSHSLGEAIAGAGRRVLSVGRAGDYISLKKVEHLQFSQIVELMHDENTYRIAFPLAGDFQIANALVAAGMAIVTGSEPALVFEALESLQGASGRLELVGYAAKGAPAYVDYAHKPEALEHVLKSLRPFTTGRIVLVFGCGGDRDTGKRAIMGKIAGNLSDLTIVTDDNPRTENPPDIRAAILAACPGAIEIADRRQAIQKAVGLLQEGDCLVVAGKGHEEGQIVGETILPFSDHQVVRDALEQGMA